MALPYTFANGELTDANEVNANFEYVLEWVANQQLQQNINILVNSAAMSSTLNPYDEMYLDIFNTAAGNDSTVDTGNTTAYFDVDKYSNINSQPSVNMTGDSAPSPYVVTSSSNNGSTYENYRAFNGNLSDAFFSHTSQTLPQWLALDVGAANAFACTEIEMISSGNATNCGPQDYLIQGSNDYSSWDTLETVTGQGTSTSGYTVTFSNTTSYRYYRIYCTVGNQSAYFAISYLKFKTTVPSKTIVQTNAETITADPIAHQVYCHNDLEGAGTLTYDVSMDGGTTWDTNQPLNTYNTTAQTGSSMIVKLNLNSASTSDKVYVEDYATMLYY